MGLSNGGTMYIHAGKPMPSPIQTTVRNLIGGNLSSNQIRID